MDVQDPLKPLSAVLEPDVRYRDAGVDLEHRHTDLSTIRLHAGVPLHVRQLFETAKNLSLYAWFVYRFHPVAESQAYAALERALKERLAIERNVMAEQVVERLRRLMIIANSNGWLKSERFSAVRRVALAQLRDEQAISMIKSGAIGDVPVELPEMDEATIVERAAEMNYVERIAEAMPNLRNHLAHGGNLLGPGSVATLRVVAEAINQLFLEPIDA